MRTIDYGVLAPLVIGSWLAAQNVGIGISFRESLLPTVAKSLGQCRFASR